VHIENKNNGILNWDSNPMEEPSCCPKTLIRYNLGESRDAELPIWVIEFE